MEAVGPGALMLGELVAVVGLLFLADRWLHQHLQGVMFLLAHDREIALWLYALVLFPGVFLHEVSHALVAAVLGVKIGRINIFPRRIGKRIQLGFVPIQETDFLRASLIGAAPLLTGSAVIFALGQHVFGTPEVVRALSKADWLAALQGLRVAFRAPDMWLWAYLAFAVGNTMIPSRADVHAWPLLIGVLVGIGAIVFFAGGDTLLLEGLSRFLTWAVRWVILLGGSTLLVDLPFFGVVFLLEKLLERLTQQRIVYR